MTVQQILQKDRRRSPPGPAHSSRRFCDLRASVTVGTTAVKPLTRRQAAFCRRWNADPRTYRKSPAARKPAPGVAGLAMFPRDRATARPTAMAWAEDRHALWVKTAERETPESSR